MKKTTNLNFFGNKIILLLFLLFAFAGKLLAQDMSVAVLGGETIINGSTKTITAGNAVTFQITNNSSTCSSVKVQSITVNNTNFSISPSNTSENIKPASCNGTNFLNFTVTRNDSACSTDITKVTISSNEDDFIFYLSVERAPVISVLGGSPLADVLDDPDTPPEEIIPSATNGTYFGVVEGGLTKTRRFYIVNTGSCNLILNSITSTNSSIDPIPASNFTITTATSPYPPYVYPIPPGEAFWFDVTFTAGDPANNEAIISITNNTAVDTDLFTFNVKAEVFDFSGPSPGGVNGEFRLWLKSTRGIRATDSKVYLWKDLGSTGKDAKQNEAAMQPTYKDDVASNINFNPVIEFENNGTVEQYLYNTDNGFYSQDIFIVMMPPTPLLPSTPITPFSSTSSRNTIFSGVNKKAIDDNSFETDDITGVGFGNYTTSLFTDEVLTYAQNTEAAFNGVAEINDAKNYSSAGIINVRNDATVATKQELLYNSTLSTPVTTLNSDPFINVGYVYESKYFGTPYWIGKNYGTPGNLNGRVAEIMTFAERVPDIDRPKIETYLAIKYGITLGATTAEQNYIDSSGNTIWDIAANDSGYNYNVAGIGRDDNSDLNQKQSKSVNDANEVTIGLGGIYTVNSLNTNEFKKDGDFLVWGCDNGTFTENGTNIVTISSSLSSTITKIDRKWKIVESGVDVGNIYIGIPDAAFSALTKTTDEEYVLIVADNENFADGAIIDVIPLKESGTNWQTWYDFDGTKFFTFGKAPKLTEASAVSIGAGDYLVGEYALNLNINAFTISAWVKSAPSANTRTIMAKGSKLQLRLNPANKVEVMVDDDTTPRFTSTMILSDGKWHNITFIYASGTIFLYVDGILDKSEQNVNPPTPNYNHFSIGAVYIDKNNIINPFLGEIDEVYVWDQGLTQNQVRYLMNQEIKRFDVSGTDYANGKVLPQAATSNEVTTIPWSKLRAYYDFNSFYGTTVEGLTNDRNFLRIKYLDKTKEITTLQTAPLPYVSAASGAWDDLATWANSDVQNLPNTSRFGGTTKVDWNIVETSHNITSGDRDITVLGLKNNSGTITIANPLTALDENNSGQGLRVTHYLELDGVIDLVGESQLIQDEGSILDQDSGGYLERDQQGTANSFNYNYWSSSVGPISGNTADRGTGAASINASFTIGGVIKDGRNSALPAAITYNTSPYAADGGSGSGTQLTISSYWLYQFYGKDDDYNSWFPRINENSPLAPGVGYTMKGSLGAVAITTSQNYVFKGKPYNGDFTLALDKSAGDVDRLIGNPYPSAMDANEFILDNIKTSETINGEVGRNSVNVFNGALYFWDHFGEINTHILKEYVGGYATYTLMDGVKAIANDARINTTSGILSTKIPQQYIPVGQGFFVITALPSGLSGTIDGGDIVFKNSQRVFVRESGITSVFMKSAKTKTAKRETNENNVNVDSRPKIWLQFDSPTGYHRQLLVGLDQNTSNHFDIGYDAPIADIGKEDMFWIFDSAKFVIQAVNNFNSDQELPLGLIVSKTGLARIKIDKLENMDENISLHIKDHLTGETHNISQKPFEINLEPGTYADRFSLTFKFQKLVAEDVPAEVLIINEPIIIEGIHVFMDNSIGELQIKNNSADEILSVALYNSLGQQINNWSKNLNRRTVSLPINTATGVYIVQINTKIGKTVKKIIIEAP